MSVSPGWPFASMFGFAPAQLTQPILPDFSLQRITFNYAGNLPIEREVVEQIASYGKQIGIITDAVLTLAGQPPRTGEDAIARLKAIAEKVEELKNRHKSSLADDARDAMERLAEVDARRAQRIAAEFAAKPPEPAAPGASRKGAKGASSR
jgi:hypothetical protein